MVGTGACSMRARRTVSLHGIEHPAAVAELDLALGGVHVYIHLGRVHAQQDDGQRVTADGQQGVIGLGYGVGQRAILNPATIDKEGDVAAIGAMQGRRADIARDRRGLMGRRVRWAL